MTAFQPLPESRAAADDLDGVQAQVPDAGGEDWLEALARLAERAAVVAPDLVGVSIARIHEGITFTVVASEEAVAALDGIQYVNGGPCVEGAHAFERREYHQDDALDEERWALFARANAARGVRSTLTLPVLGSGPETVVGSVNLYARSTEAFAGRADQLAEVFGAYAAGAVANADLPFRTQEEARRAPDRVRDLVAIETAVGLLAADCGHDLDRARRRIEQAAQQAGVSVEDLAREVIAAHRDRPPSTD